jgi:phage repressor protein C with HTH and peptisase S24 domain
MGKIPDHQALLRAIFDKTKWNQAQIAQELGVSQSSISRWKDGEELERPNYVRLETLARKLGLINRKPHGNAASVEIVGYVGAGGTVSYDANQGSLGEADMPPNGALPSLVAVIVKGDSMSGTLEDGWVVYYDNRKEPPDENLFSKLCIVGLRDGRTLVKRLYPGRKRGHYDLHSANAPALLDQPVDWAAKITWIAPT